MNRVPVLRNIVRLLLPFALLLSAAAVQALPDVKVYPNPWIPEDNRILTGNLTDGIRFEGLPAGGEIEVYTITGSLVIRMPFPAGTAYVRWWGKNSEDEDVASGVYIWVLKHDGPKMSGKIIVIR